MNEDQIKQEIIKVITKHPAYLDSQGYTYNVFEKGKPIEPSSSSPFVDDIDIYNGNYILTLSNNHQISIPFDNIASSEQI
jgi:hypothetical protein